MHACILFLALMAPEPIFTLDLVPLRQLDLTATPNREKAWEQLHAAATLQGIVNRESPRLYFFLVGDENANTDRFWWNVMTQPGGWLADRPVEALPDLDAALARFRTEIRGAIVWDPAVPATANLASTLAGLENAVALRPSDDPTSLFARWTQDEEGPRLPILVDLRGRFTGAETGSAKNDAHRWAIRELIQTGRANPRRLGYYPDAFWITRPNGIGTERTLLANHDWIVAQRGFIFDLGPWDDVPVDDDLNQPLGTDGATFRLLLDACYEAAQGEFIHIAGFTPWDQKYTDFTGGPQGGVATEWRTVEIATQFNAYLDADAAGLHAMANASFFQHFPLAERYEQTPSEVVPEGPLAAFYVGDYDSAAWLYQQLPIHWTDPARGTIPLGWAFNPALAIRFPLGMDFARRNATPLDTFVAGDSGAGYVNPGGLDTVRTWSGKPSGLEAWERYSTPMLRQWDLTVAGFLIDGFTPPMNHVTLESYARMFPGGFVEHLAPPRGLVNGVPVLRMASDLPRNTEEAAQLIAADFPADPQATRIYRTVLWTPTEHRALMERVKQLRPEITWVDPHVLLRAARERS